MTTNLIGIHALCWVGGWSPEEARRAIASSKEAGYDLIQLAALDPENFDADMTAKLLQEHDILGDVSLGLSEETDISSEDPDCVARGRQLLDTAVKLTRDIGGAYLGGVLSRSSASMRRRSPSAAGPTRSSRSRGSPTAPRRPA